jgi:hypothetical protein
MSNTDMGLVVVFAPLCVAFLALMLIEYADRRSTRR